MQAKNLAPELTGKGTEFDSQNMTPKGASLTGVLVAKLQARHADTNELLNPSIHPHIPPGVFVVTCGQEFCPKAHVIYASATAASELRNLGYMSRLGLWGEGVGGWSAPRCNGLLMC